MLGLEGLDLRLDASPALLEGELGGHVLLGLRSPVLGLLAGLERGVLANRSICVRVDLLHVLGTDAIGKVGRELLLEAGKEVRSTYFTKLGIADVPLVILLLKRLHVLRDVTTVDVLLQNLSVELLGLRVVARETLLVVGNEEATVGGTLEGTEHTGTSRRALETDVKVALERTRRILLISRLSHRKSTIGLRNTLVLVREAELGEGTARAQKASRVGC